MSCILSLSLDCVKHVLSFSVSFYVCAGEPVSLSLCTLLLCDPPVFLPLSLSDLSFACTLTRTCMQDLTQMSSHDPDSDTEDFSEGDSAKTEGGTILSTSAERFTHLESPSVAAAVSPLAVHRILSDHGDPLSARSASGMHRVNEREHGHVSERA